MLGALQTQTNWKSNGYCAFSMYRKMISTQFLTDRQTIPKILLVWFVLYVFFSFVLRKYRATIVYKIAFSGSVFRHFLIEIDDSRRRSGSETGNMGSFYLFVFIDWGTA